MKEVTDVQSCTLIPGFVLNKRREVKDVQRSEEGLSERRIGRDEVQQDQRSTQVDRSSARRRATEKAGISAGDAAGAGAGQQQSSSEWSGGLGKFPLDMTRGPQTRVEGTEVVTER